MQTALFDDTLAAMREILLKKGNDYSNEDRLSNFKLAGTISGVKPTVACLVLCGVKVARLGVLLNSPGQPNNESIDDTLLDLANYSILLRMLVLEEENGRRKTQESI